MLRGVVIVVLGACGFQSGQPITPPSDALDGPAIDADVRPPDAPDAPPDAPPPEPPPLCDPKDALMACYTFDRNLDDESSHHLNPNPVMNAVTGAGRFGMALQLSEMSVVDVPDSDVLDVAALTIEAWVKLTALPPPGKRAVIIDVDGQYSLAIGANGAATCVLARDVTLSGGTLIRVGVWTHVACTYGSGIGALYVDGFLGPMQAGGSAIRAGGKTGMSIGGDNAGPMRSHLVGSIDELRLMNVARTPAEICASTGRYDCLTPVPIP